MYIYLKSIFVVAVRLTGSELVNYGRVELWSDDGWYSVCDENFDDMDATVVCRALGYVTGKSQCCSALGRIGTANPIMFSNFSCTGTEADPKLCPFVKSSTCRNGHYVSVLCLKTATPKEGDYSVC